MLDRNENFRAKLAIEDSFVELIGGEAGSTPEIAVEAEVEGRAEEAGGEAEAGAEEGGDLDLHAARLNPLCGKDRGLLRLRWRIRGLQWSACLALRRRWQICVQAS